MINLRLLENIFKNLRYFKVFGRYKYKIKGLLYQIKYIKPCHVALIIENKDYSKIIKLIKRYSISYVNYNIEVKQIEFEK